MLLTMMDERQFKWQSKKVILCEIFFEKVDFHAIKFIDLIFFQNFCRTEPSCTIFTEKSAKTTNNYKFN